MAKIERTIRASTTVSDLNDNPELNLVCYRSLGIGTPTRTAREDGKKEQRVGAVEGVFVAHDVELIRPIGLNDTLIWTFINTPLARYMSN